jgi:hypothetical protein
MIVVSICLSDIPKERITTSERNGKKYASIVVDERKEPDTYGNTHSVYMNLSKEERLAKEPKIYCGSGKEFKFESKPTTPNYVESAHKSASTVASHETIDDDLPF